MMLDFYDQKEIRVDVMPPTFIYLLVCDNNIIIDQNAPYSQFFSLSCIKSNNVQIHAHVFCLYDKIKIHVVTYSTYVFSSFVQ